MRKKAAFSLEQQLRRYKLRSRILIGVIVVILGLNGFYLWLNYDYLVFKHFISQFYIYTETLDSVYKKELNLDVKGKYYSYFDNLVIAAITKVIR